MIRIKLMFLGIFWIAFAYSQKEYSIGLGSSFIPLERLDTQSSFIRQKVAGNFTVKLNDKINLKLQLISKVNNFDSDYSSYQPIVARDIKYVDYIPLQGTKYDHNYTFYSITFSRDLLPYRVFTFSLGSGLSFISGYDTIIEKVLTSRFPEFNPGGAEIILARKNVNRLGFDFMADLDFRIYKSMSLKIQPEVQYFPSSRQYFTIISGFLSFRF